MVEVDAIRKIRRDIEAARGGARPDVARELSIAVTHLEDAEMRVKRAFIRTARHKADAEKAVDEAVLLVDEDLTAPDEAGEETSEKEVG